MLAYGTKGGGVNCSGKIQLLGYVWSGSPESSLQTIPQGGWWSIICAMQRAQASESDYAEISMLVSVTEPPNGALRADIVRVFAAQRAVARRLRTSTGADRITKIKKLRSVLLAHRA